MTINIAGKQDTDDMKFSNITNLLHHTIKIAQQPLPKHCRMNSCQHIHKENYEGNYQRCDKYDHSTIVKFRHRRP